MEYRKLRANKWIRVSHDRLLLLRQTEILETIRTRLYDYAGKYERK